MSTDTQLAKSSPQESSKIGVMNVLAAKYNVAPARMLDTLKETVFKGATEPQMVALAIVASEYNLNPFLREIYAFPAKSGGIVPVVSVDGWIKLMNSHPQFDGVEFSYDGNGDNPVSCCCCIYRKDRSRPVTVTEYFKECTRGTDPWKTAPRRMLRHKALIQCIRVAFGFSAYDDDEGAIAAERAVAGREVKPARVIMLLPPKESRDDARDDARERLDHIADGEPPVFPGERKPKEPTSARGAVEGLAKAGDVEMSEVISAAIALEIINDVGQSVNDYGPGAWAQIEARWQEVLTEAQAR